MRLQERETQVAAKRPSAVQERPTPPRDAWPAIGHRLENREERILPCWLKDSTVNSPAAPRTASPARGSDSLAAGGTRARFLLAAVLPLPLC